MTRIESEKIKLNKSSKEVFDFLSNFNNFQKLMPEQVINWTSNDNECNFTIKGMASLGMKYDSKTPNSEIKIKPNGKVPFDFDLNAFLNDTEQGSEAQLVMNADLNPFLKMMAEKPLKKFLDMLVNKLKSL